MTSIRMKTMAERSEGIGARKEKARRYKLGWLTLMIAVGGGIAGAAIAIHRNGVLDAAPILSPTLAIAMVVAFVAMIALVSIAYYRQCDELEMSNQLWSNFWGMHALLVLYPSWLALSWAGLVDAPDAGRIFLIPLGVTAIAYCWKKYL